MEQKMGAALDNEKKQNGNRERFEPNASM